MRCTTVRENQECVFMKKSGCSYEGGACKPIDEKCEGCNRVGVFPLGKYCTSVPDPTTKWLLGNCNLATHIVAEVVETKAKVNPLKASKRGARGK